MKFGGGGARGWRDPEDTVELPCSDLRKVRILEASQHTPAV